VFTRQLAELASLDTLFAIQAELIENQNRWPVVKGTAGARKGRIGVPGRDRGKRGSLRHLYLYLEHRGQIYLLLLFSKAEQSNLSPKQTEQVAALVRAIKGMPDED